MTLNAFAALKEEVVLYRGDTIRFDVYLQKYSGSPTFSIPNGATFRVLLPGESGTIELTAPEVTLISYGSGGIRVIIPPAVSRTLRPGKLNVLVVVENGENYSQTFETTLPAVVKSRPLSV